MDGDQIREWRAGYEAVNRLALEEARLRTPRERLRLHRKFLERLGAGGRLPARDPNDKFYVRWLRVRDKWLERHPAA